MLQELYKFQRAMLIYLCILFTLLGVYYYFQAKKFNERVEYVYNTSLNDSVLAIKYSARAELKLWVKNDSILLISPLKKKNAFNLFDQGYNKISKKEKSSKLVFSNGIDSIPIFLAYPED